MRDRHTDAAELAAAGYASGVGAPVVATARAAARVSTAAVVVLVEGISDQAAVETAALCRGRDLRAERVVVTPVGGAHAVGRFLRDAGPLEPGARVLGLCDAREEDVFRRGLGDAAAAGESVFVCVADLEDELVRALGPARVEACVAAQGDLGALRALRAQPAWRGRPADTQLRRFLGSVALRKTRYARVLVERAARDGVLPAPLARLLDAARPV